MKLYLHYVAIQVKSAMQYKSSFFLTVLGQFLVSFNVFLGILFMFTRFSQVEGFTYSQVMLCFGIMLIQFTIAECIFRGFDTFSGMIKRGEFDRILVRPKNEMLQVLGSKFELTRIGRLLQAIVMLIYGINHCEVVWTQQKVITVVFMMIGGIAVFSGIFILYASVCFFTVENLEFMNVFIDGAREYGKYPVGIYGKSILKICTFIIPYALIQYYPLLYLLDLSSRWYDSFLPLLACLFLIPCILFWKYGVHRYQSVGS